MEENQLFKSLDEIVEKSLKDGYPTHGLARVLRLLEKEKELYKNHIQGLKDWEEKRDKVDTTKIQIGGGSHTLDGFLNIDIVAPADLVCDIREGLPLNDECSEFIFSEHTFEHLDYPVSEKKVVNECYRVLKPGGKIVVGVPDANKAIMGYVNKDMELFNEYMERWYPRRDCKEHFNTWLDLVNYVLRDQDDDPVYNPHYWGYDYEKLESMLKDAGFKTVEPWQYDPTIGNAKREWGAVYVIATK